MAESQRDKRVIFQVADGPEGIEIYTSEYGASVDWSHDFPALYIEASVNGSYLRMGPFHCSKIREYFENIREQMHRLEGLEK